ncbi:3-carboxy-cis,cis-muconate cycloisomerase [Oricola cellulosilytica]|uniref:3-carboxy-cis,cis-muconate cycloisomerase n=1 Tax=Oricola cellulosilytica TaxID=1429082 RepID=A0A4R0P501_9HYPH|nr:3-carboxy-cis,cis-muconate cycloisomerase [Oricola cellulosilytica]TCD11933.1 3-carboxy-cis,cis-muconate cycloisomerase [Oricola cellulosilytica]
MSYTPFNAPILSGLLGDAELTPFFSVREDINAMVRFESACALCEGRHGLIPEDAATAIFAACKTFAPDLRSIGEATARDGVAVPELVRQLREHVGEPHAGYVHYRATSQDVVDTSFVLRMEDAIAVIEDRLKLVDTALHGLEKKNLGRSLMARTRMQPALPIAAEDRIRAWRAPITGHLATLDDVKTRLLVVQFGGPVGTLSGPSNDNAAFASDLAAELGLGRRDTCWHTDRSSIVAFANWLSLVTGSLGKFGRDIALMAQSGANDITLAGGGVSSAMPHKQNPVKAEVLVSLAHFNAVQVSGMHHAMVHEQERSGAAWTLEWMLMPPMVVATGAALRNSRSLIDDIEQIGGAAVSDGSQ